MQIYPFEGFIVSTHRLSCPALPPPSRSEYHTQLANMSFDKIFDLTAAVYFHFYNLRTSIPLYVSSYQPFLLGVGTLHIHSGTPPLPLARRCWSAGTATPVLRIIRQHLSPLSRERSRQAVGRIGERRVRWGGEGGGWGVGCIEMGIHFYQPNFSCPLCCRSHSFLSDHTQPNPHGFPPYSRKSCIHFFF